MKSPRQKKRKLRDVKPHKGKIHQKIEEKNTKQDIFFLPKAPPSPVFPMEIWRSTETSIPPKHLLLECVKSFFKMKFYSFKMHRMKFLIM